MGLLVGVWHPGKTSQKVSTKTQPMPHMPLYQIILDLPVWIISNQPHGIPLMTPLPWWREVIPKFPTATGLPGHSSLHIHKNGKTFHAPKFAVATLPWCVFGMHLDGKLWGTITNWFQPLFTILTHNNLEDRHTLDTWGFEAWRGYISAAPRTTSCGFSNRLLSGSCTTKQNPPRHFSLKPVRTWLVRRCAKRDRVAELQTTVWPFARRVPEKSA